MFLKNTIEHILLTYLLPFAISLFQLLSVHNFIPVVSTIRKDDSDSLYNIQYYRLNLAKEHFQYLKDNKLWDEYILIVDSSKINREKLTKRLIQTGDLKSSGTDSIGLYQAILNFQVRHCISETGFLDEETLRELNRPVSDIINQIENNMARAAKLPVVFGEKYLYINIADYQLQFFENGNKITEMHVIVGKTYRKTPVFSAALTHIVFNPDWIIPPTILREDVLPLVRKDINYLRKKNMLIYKLNRDGSKAIVNTTDIDWKNTSTGSFPYQIIQKPGKDNPMGVIKFLFPNSYNVYMHDTPSKELFEMTNRTFSSGCIRLSNAELLATELLDEQGVTPEMINNFIKSGKTQTIYLNTPVPVHITYFTCWVDDEGKLHFRPDIYKRDASVSG